MPSQSLTRSLLRRARFVRQTGNGHFALIVAAFEPSPQQQVFGLDSDELPKEFEKGALKGLTESLGRLSCCVKLVDAAYHEVDSRPLDFEYAGRLLGKEVLKEPLGPAPAHPPDPKQVLPFWTRRWDDARTALREGLAATVTELGFRIEGDGFSREWRGLMQNLSVSGDAPRLPAAADLRLTLHFGPRKLGQLQLSVSLGRPAWKLESPDMVSEILSGFSSQWLEQSCDPGHLLERRPAGIHWWSPVVETRLLLLAGRIEPARRRALEALKELRGKLGRGREVAELESISKELS